MASQKKKIQILTSDMGFGHRSAAEAIASALSEKYGDHCECKIENPLNHPKAPNIARESQSNYDEIVKNLPEMYKMGYRISDSTLPVTLMEGAFIAALYEPIKETIKAFQPDLVITAYPIYQAPIDAFLTLNNQHIPLMTVVTDLVTVHHVWFNPRVTRLTVPTDAVKERALKAGLKPGQIIKTGIPINPQILALKQKDVPELRKALNWQTDPVTVLAVASPRVSVLTDILETLDHSGFDLQFALVAGGNDDLYRIFQETDWHHPAAVYNFVEFIPKLMRAADIILCKAGGLIVTESLSSGLPIMVSQAIPGQEEGNLGFIVDNHAGARCLTPLDALKTLSHWLAHDRGLLKEVSANAEILVPADAAYRVADSAWDMLENPVEDRRKRETGPLRDLLARFNITSS